MLTSWLWSESVTHFSYFSKITGISANHCWICFWNIHRYVLSSKVSHQNWCLPWGAPRLKNTPHPLLKSEALFQEMIPRKKPEKLETVINTCVSIINHHQKKNVKIPQEHDFLRWSIQTFVRKVKQFVRKYYITCRPVKYHAFCMILLHLF